MLTVTIQDCEKAIKVKAENWKGRCHEIAGMILDSGIIVGRLTYGHWLGPIADDSYFVERKHLPFVQHGWITDPKDVHVIDPTRWVFEAAEPYIFFGVDEDDYYDEGGCEFRQANMGLAPVFDPNEKMHELDGLSHQAQIYICDLMTCEYTSKFSMSQLFWLGNQGPYVLNHYCGEIYAEFNRLKLKALIPLDNWLQVMEHPFQ